MAHTISILGTASLTDIDLARNTYGKTPITVDGIVSPESQGGYPLGGEFKFRIHRFTFSAWKKLGGELVSSELSLLRPVPLDEEFFGDFPAYSVIRLAVLLSEKRTRAIVDKVIDVNLTDDELRSYGESLRSPVEIAYPALGTLRLDRSLNVFNANVKWGRKKIRLTFVAVGQAQLDLLVPNAQQLIAEQQSWSLACLDYACKELLVTKNSNWLESDEEPLTATEFKNSMTLQSISFQSDGDFEFWFDCGDLFSGHAITICGSLKEGLTQATLAG